MLAVDSELLRNDFNLVSDEDKHNSYVVVLRIYTLYYMDPH